MGNLPFTIIVALIALLIALPGCINNALALKDRWRHPPTIEPASQRQAVSRSLFIFNIIGAALLLWVAYQMWLAPSQIKGFSKGWPDAILCKGTEPEGKNPSELVFYYKETAAARNEIGAVVVYLLVGGQNGVVPTEKERSYFPHEIWFDEKEKRLLGPNDVSDSGTLSLRYKMFFLPDLDCGGKTIEKIKEAGRAFSFAMLFR
jgi:hypothetical protein